MLSAEERTKEKEKQCCYECGKPILRDEDHVTMQVYDSPWGPPKEITVHESNADNCWDTCEFRLTDTSWSDFRYFDCSCCGRRICRQCLSNGWLSYVREYRGKEICLRCYEELQFREGSSRQSFENGRIEGMFHNNGVLTAHGFKLVPEFYGYHISDAATVSNYCGTAIRLIEEGYIVVNEYDLMDISSGEGNITMWVKKGSHIRGPVSH